MPNDPRDNTLAQPRDASSSDPRIVFMGTPEFAVASLDAIVSAGYRVVAVITAPDKPAGRGMQVSVSAVKKYALEKGLPLLQPEKLKNPSFLEDLRTLKADLQIVVAFRMLPEAVWDMPSMGTVNLHGSLLPQYRGAAPINWAVINGEPLTGVTTFRLQHAIDTGNILMQESFPVGVDETAGEVHDKMKMIGARLLVRTIDGLVAGSLQETPQTDVFREQRIPGANFEIDPSELKHAPKIVTETCRIDWNRPAWDVHNLIRGLSPFPTAFTELDGRILKIYRSEIEKKSPDTPPGTHDTDGKTYLRWATTDGYIRATELQLEGKKKMLIADFLRGYRGPAA